MKSIAVLMCLAVGAQFAGAQYKAILSTPTAPLATMTGNGDVKALVDLRAISNGYAWGQYFGRAVKVSVADGSITFLENNALPAYPTDFSAVLATDGTNAIGYTGGSVETCVSWDATGVATTFTTPLFQETLCSAASGGVVGGYLENNSTNGGTLIPSTQRAALWTSPTSFIDLHTGGNNFSQVLGMAGNQQAGFQSTSPVGGQTGNLFFGGAYPTAPGTYSAYLWHGSTSGAVNLNPAGFTSSLAFTTNGSQQGGYAYDSATRPSRHAMLWSGSAASALDLSSAPWFDTEVRALSATTQVGDGYEGVFSEPGAPIRHALAWSGSAASMIDLNIFLPPGFNNAVANAIDADGNIVGHAWMQVGRAYSFAPVIFKPQAASPWQLLSVTLSAGEVNQGDSVQGQLTLAGPAPAGGQLITLSASFQDGYPISDLVPVPASVVVPEGQTTAFFNFTTNNRFADIGGQFWTRVYANDGTVSRFALLKVDMQPFLTAFTIPTPVYGGTAVNGTVSTDGYSWPAGTAVVSLVSGNPAILTVPATVSIPVSLPVPTASFPITTAQVTTATVVPVTASINGSYMSLNVTVLPAPPATLTGLSVSQEVVGGNPYSGTVTFSGPVPFGGATVSLVSDNPAVVPVPATVSAAQGQSSISFSGVTGAVGASVTAHITATYNGVSLTAPITVNNEPPVKITNAEYDTIALVVKVSATTQIANSTLTFGIDTAPGTVVSMSLSNGVWSGSLKNVKSAPGLITVWNSNGGSASMAPTLRAK
ncbi:MAG TPA: hypothetical protein VNH18_34395 [Bryobacteraceae bacterium]|nr:hypothetical protein [Bryobacteraceae bacterium]